MLVFSLNYIFQSVELTIEMTKLKTYFKVVRLIYEIQPKGYHDIDRAGIVVEPS